MKIRPANPHQAFLYQIGDKVEHNAFGRGTVIEIKIPLITISFLPPYGIKKLDIKHPSFKKVESLFSTLQKHNHPFDE
ncbi:MAG: hypothetical protein WJU30_00189 [Candidatus Phytoplasma pruni]